LKQYLDIVDHVLTNGQERNDRTGTGTLSVFSYQAMYDLRNGFPMITTAKKNEKNIFGETLWYLEGNTNANYLAEKYGFKIWKKWANNKKGELGRIYGKQWRDYRGVQTTEKGVELIHVDQIKYLINEIKTNPYSRRMVLNSWNPAELHLMALPPCHWSFELYIDGENMDTLNMKIHQRSCDVFLGVPYNIASYALLLSMFAHVTGLTAGVLIHDMTNVHIYKDHIEQMKEQLTREPKGLPTLWLNPDVKDIDGFTMDDIKLNHYDPHPPLKGNVSI
jgi:thymidylate synthase